MADKQTRLEAYRMKDVNLRLGLANFKLDVVIAPIQDPMLLGIDFLYRYKLNIDLSKECLFSGDNVIPATIRSSPRGDPYTISRVTMTKTITVPPNSVRLAEVELEDLSIPVGKEVLVEPLNCNADVLVPYTLAVGDRKVTLSFTNLTDRHIKIPTNEFVARAVAIDTVLEDEDDPSASASHAPQTIQNTLPQVTACP